MTSHSLRTPALASSVLATLVMLAAGACGPQSAAERTPSAGIPAPADSTPAAPPSSGPVTVTRLRAEPYSFAYNSGFTQPARIVINDSAAWRAEWERLHSRGGPLPALPSVDFTRHSVILAALGRRATGGYSIIVDGGAVARDTLFVTVLSIRPGPRCGTTAALSEPVDVALVPQQRRPVSFVERDSVHVCP